MNQLEIMQDETIFLGGGAYGLSLSKDVNRDTNGDMQKSVSTGFYERFEQILKKLKYGGFL